MLYQLSYASETAGFDTTAATQTQIHLPAGTNIKTNTTACHVQRQIIPL